MNQQFNLSRFNLFLKYYWAENGKSYLISLALIIGIMLFLMLPIVGTDRYRDMLFILHILGLFGGVLLGGSLFTSTAFNSYATSERGISAIMLPASRLEKFLGILLAHLLFASLVFVVGYLLHYGLAGWANQDIPDNQRKYGPAPIEVMLVLGFSYAILQGAVFLGSLYFTENSFIKMLGIVLIVVIVAFIFNLFLAYHFTGYTASVMALPFTFWNVFDGQTYVVDYPPPMVDLRNIFLGLIVVGLISITYVRLREKEI